MWGGPLLEHSSIRGAPQLFIAKIDSFERQVNGLRVPTCTALSGYSRFECPLGMGRTAEREVLKTTVSISWQRTTLTKTANPRSFFHCSVFGTKTLCSLTTCRSGLAA